MKFEQWWALSNEHGKPTSREQLARDAWEAAQRTQRLQIVEAVDHAVAKTYGSRERVWAQRFRQRLIAALDLFRV